MMLVGPINSGLTTGGAGVSTANADSKTILRGRLVGIYLKHNGSPPATSDVVVKTKGTAPYPPSYNLLTRTNLQTDGWFYPQVAVTDVAGVAIAGEYGYQVVHDYINVSIAQANDGDSVDVWLLLSNY